MEVKYKLQQTFDPKKLLFCGITVLNKSSYGTLKGHTTLMELTIIKLV